MDFFVPTQSELTKPRPSCCCCGCRLSSILDLTVPQLLLRTSRTPDHSEYPSAIAALSGATKILSGPIPPPKDPFFVCLVPEKLGRVT